MLNRITIIGRLGADPSSQTFPSGDTQGKMNVATSESWRDKASGEWKERTQWHNVIIKNAAMITRASKMRKGEMVLVEGTMTYRKYNDSNGVERSIAEIAVGPFEGQVRSLSTGQSGNSDSERSPPPPAASSSDQRGYPYNTLDRPSAGAALDDDIPF